MRVLLPISLDRWRNPIATLLRACVVSNPDLEFFSCSNPQSDEDRAFGRDFWALPNIVQAPQSKLALMRFDLVHTASITVHNQAAVVMAKARSRQNCQYLATINLQVGPKDGKDWPLLRSAEILADAMVAVSEAAAAGSRGRVGNRFHGVIPNGFDATYHDPAIEDEEVLPASVRALPRGSFALYVGALEPRKHPEYIVELARRHPDMIFVGAGYVHPLGHHFVPMVHSLPNLLWLGHVDRRCIRALFRHAGVMLFPSEREGLALSVIEAMGMGLPVIGQPKSSMPELIQPGINGALHDISEHQAWSDSLRSYLQWSTAEREAFRERTRADIVARYDWPVIGRQYGKIYQQLLA
jgi:glycosyltransferase involved in cell wall biosynthesis